VNPGSLSQSNKYAVFLFSRFPVGDSCPHVLLDLYVDFLFFDLTEKDMASPFSFFPPPVLFFCLVLLVDLMKR